MEESNPDIARRGFEAVVAGDFNVVADFLAPDVKWHGGDPDAPGACQGRDQALRFMKRAFGQGGIGTLVDVIGAGDQVVVIVRPAPGEPCIANLTTFREGKAVEMVHYVDPDDALASLGRGRP